MKESRNIPRNLNEYIINYSLNLKRLNKSHTSRNLKSSLANLEKFRDYQTIDFKDIDCNFVKEYDNFLSNKKISEDTASFYMRTFKMILNHASEDGFLKYEAEWFNSVNTNAYRRTERTIQRSLDLSLLKKISNLDLSDNPKLDFARDLFMFSFYMQGLELSDILDLKKENIVDGCIVFRRRKVGQTKTVPLTGKALAIIAKNSDETDDALFPLKIGYNIPSLKSVSSNIIRYILAIGTLVGFPKLSFSQARATWLAVTSQVNLVDRLMD